LVIRVPIAVLIISAACLSSPAPCIAAPQAFQPTVRVGGNIQVEFDGGSAGDSRFPGANRIFVRRARIAASGAAMPSLTYRVQLDLGGGLSAASGIKGELSDGYVEWTRHSAAHIRLGQFKAPFGREWLTPATDLITVERTLVSDRLTLNRQIGVAALGDLRGGRVGYSAGIFNGTGRNTNTNDNDAFLVAGRATAAVWRTKTASVQAGLNGYWSHDTRLSMPADFGLDATPETPAADNLFTGRRRGAGVDARLDWGAWRVDAELLRVRFAEDRAAGDHVRDAHGWYVAPAAFVHARIVQLVARYERFQPAEAADDRGTRTWAAGVNCYPRGASVKLAFNYLWVDAPLARDAHQKVLAALQLVF
jgi:phosphate-selective porin